MRPSLTKVAAIGMGMLALALVLVVIGSIAGQGGFAWVLPLVALPIMVELVVLWQKNLEWLGNFLLTTDGILCESPLSAPLLLKWEEIEDCYYLPGKSAGAGTYCLCSEKLTLRGDGQMPAASAHAKYVKITEREGLHEALRARLPEVLGKKLDADKML
ncbi:MAG: hypothetical protein IJX76_09595 [Clostridia bacterium]|nr:hypothetical protein [Clostridia bacterium]